MVYGWKITRNGKDVVARDLPGPTYAGAAFCTAATQQTNECSLELVDPEGEVVRSVDLGEGDLMLPGPPEGKAAKKAAKKRAARGKKKT
jgi:hypothetical protein